MTTVAPEIVYLIGAASGLSVGALIWASHSFTKMIEATKK